MRKERQASTAGKEPASSQQWQLMERVVERGNLIQALKRVVSNKGAPGVDGMTVKQLTPYLKEHWPRLKEELLGGKYRPQAIRAKDIPKPGGKGTRRLGIPTVLDRFIQQAVLQVLTPLFEPTFSASSYGYRPGRSAQQAVKAGQGHIHAGHRWVVDLDLEKFFDRVNHDILLSRVARRVKDKTLLKLIRRYVEAGIMVEGVVQLRDEGTPQGGPLSPLLSNIMLDELDKELERRGHVFCRYADDANVYVKSRKAGERVMVSLERFLWKRLKLKINRDKSVVAQPWRRKFLGYTVTWERKVRLQVSRDSAKRLRRKLKPLFRQGRGQALTHVIGRINGITVGWVSYFRLVETQRGLEELDKWVRHCIRCLLWRQWKRPRTRAKRMRQMQKSRGCRTPKISGGRGPWSSSRYGGMNAAVPRKWLEEQGLRSLVQEHERLAASV